MRIREAASPPLNSAPSDSERKLAALRTLLENPSSAQPSAGPLLLGMGEAAAMIPCSRASLWRLCKAGRIPRVELFPGTFKIRKSDLLRFVEGLS